MVVNKTIIQRYDEIEQSCLGFDEDTIESLTTKLNRDIAGLYALYHQLKKHHWNVEGDNFRDLHEYLGDIAYDVEEYADVVAERVQALGAVPLSGMNNYAERIPFETEDKNVYSIRTSLENDLEAFKVLIHRIRERVSQAYNNQDYVTENMLRDGLEMLEEHAHHIEHYLEDDSLTVND